MRYRYNPSCTCGRCRAHGFMGPAVLITLGVLFLLDQLTHVRWLDFGSTWPAFLIVIGLVMFLEHNASMAGHVPREYGMMSPPAAPVYPGQPQSPAMTPPVVTPPPVPPAGSTAPGTTWNNPDDPEVRNG
jgi:LiaI-LiaF-like transmembrane region